MKKLIIIIAVIVVLAGGAYLGLQAMGRKAQEALGAMQTAQVKRGTLAAEINSAGTVQPASSVSLVFQASGQVQKVLVKEGDLVRAGQQIACIDATDLQLAVDSAQASLEAAEARLAQAKKPADAEDIAAARASLASAQENLARIEAGPTARDIEIARLRLEQAKDQLWGAQGARDATMGNPMVSGAQEAQAKANVAANEMAVEIARLQYEQAQEPPQAVDILAAKVQVAQAQATLAKLTRGPAPEDILVAEAAVKQAQVALRQAEEKLADACLTAPVAGTLTRLDLEVGQMVGPTVACGTIADLSTLQISSDMSEIDVAQIVVGQPVSITFDALSGKSYQGHVVQVAPDGVITQGVVNFPVTIEINEADPAIKPGMTANVSIITEERKDVLMVPSRAVRTVGGKRVVALMRDGLPQDVEVRVGLSGDGYTEVLGDTLKEGDIVVVSFGSSLQRQINAARGTGPAMQVDG